MQLALRYRLYTPVRSLMSSYQSFFTVTAPTDIYTLSLHDALPIFTKGQPLVVTGRLNSSEWTGVDGTVRRSEEHTSELQSRGHLVCRLLLEKKKTNGATRDAMTIACAAPDPAQAVDTGRRSVRTGR